MGPQAESASRATVQHSDDGPCTCLEKAFRPAFNSVFHLCCLSAFPDASAGLFVERPRPISPNLRSPKKITRYLLDRTGARMTNARRRAPLASRPSPFCRFIPRYPEGCY